MKELINFCCIVSCTETQCIGLLVISVDMYDLNHVFIFGIVKSYPNETCK